MAIPFQKYVDITSGVGGAAQVSARELIARLFTENPLLPTKSFSEFTDLASVGLYFGTTSEEYKRALFYFSWISKLSTTPSKISFARWANEDTAPMIFGEEMDQDLTAWNAITDGAFALTMSPDTEIITGLDFSPAASLADVAAIVQTAIQAANVDTKWAGGLVVYNASTKNFNFGAGATGVSTISVVDAGSGTEIASMLGWLNSGTILSDGVLEESISDVLTESAGASNNFGSYLFMPALTLTEVEESAAWNDAQNVMFQFYHMVLQIDSETFYDALSGYSGYGQMLMGDGIADEYPDMLPMNILAATDYSRRNANQNYMYQQFNITATVDNGPDSNALDAIRTNYYGQTQQAGSSIEFFQRGKLMGLATAPTDMNTYANEQWLKDANGVSIMGLFLALSAISASDTGRAQVISVIQPNIDLAKFNGTILEGKTLTPIQRAYVLSVTGDENAYRQIEGSGYWLDSAVVEKTPGEFVITYILLYAKGDVVRKVEGTHTLL
tara:strand:- start:16464 stop:17963 length:1500 start_codon:yes stop_codon:yes gene_type:complete